jgi:hypothetical protein
MKKNRKNTICMLILILTMVFSVPLEACAKENVERVGTYSLELDFSGMPEVVVLGQKGKISITKMGDIPFDSHINENTIKGDFYTSINTSVISIDRDGNWTALKEGTTEIHCSTTAVYDSKEVMDLLDKYYPGIDTTHNDIATYEEYKVKVVKAQTSVYRLYNKNSGEHFYTTNIAEKDKLVSLGWKDEGVGWETPGVGNPVYRLYNKNSGEHHYTTNAKERDKLVALTWKDEGISWYSDKAETVAVYRLYNPNARGQYEAGGHHHTTNLAERDKLVGLGWKDEGVGFYANAIK